MLAKDPENRITSKEALAHPAFEEALSKSPLIIKDNHNPEDLLKMQEFAKKLVNKREETEESQGKSNAQQHRRFITDSTQST